MSKIDVILGVLLFFKNKENKYALHLRKTGFNAGLYCTPGGHNEGVETYEDCAIRESLEEVGVKIKKSDLKPAHLLYRKGNARDKIGGVAIRPDMCFVIEKWDDEFHNNEPEKHGDIEWFSPKDIPDNTVDYVGQALKNIGIGVFYSTHGF